MEMSRVMSLAMSLGLSRGTESDADNEDELASEFDLDADSGASRSRRDYNAVAVAMLRKMTLHNGFLERPCKFRNLFCMARTLEMFLFCAAGTMSSHSP